jgi:hypothetical protein
MAFTFVRRVTGDLPVIIAIWSGGKRAFGKIRCISNKSQCLNGADIGHGSNPIHRRSYISSHDAFQVLWIHWDRCHPSKGVLRSQGHLISSVKGRLISAMMKTRIAGWGTSRQVTVTRSRVRARMFCRVWWHHSFGLR